MMKRLKYLTLATLVAFAACDEGEGVLEPAVGTVTVSVTAEGENVDGATVTLTGESSQSMTTSGGTATFQNVMEGTYAVSLSGIPGDYVFGNTSATVTIDTDGQNATVSFTGNIVRTASISGQVTASGVGVEGVTVEISGGGDGITQSKQTDAGGSYAFTGLRSGDYTVTISGFDPDRFDFPSTQASVNLTPGESEVVNFSGAGGAEATISIQSITQGGGPIPLSNVNGQIEVTANLQRGQQTVQEIDVLIDGEVVATQVLTPPSELEAEQVLETLTLNVATDQIEMAENGWVPVVFNGGAFISLNAWVEGETSPIPSNEVPIVMNNHDKVLILEDNALTPDTPEPSITVDGDVWMTGGAGFAGLNYLAYSGVMPDDVVWPADPDGEAIPDGWDAEDYPPADDDYCEATGTLTGTPTTGIVIENAYDCSDDEGELRPDAAGIDVDTDDDGPDGTPVQAAGANDYVRRGAQFTLGHEPQSEESETRHFIVSREADFDALNLDNLGPTVCIDGEGSDGVAALVDDPNTFCPDFMNALTGDEALPGDLTDDLRVAFRDLFDEWWVNADHEYAAPVEIFDQVNEPNDPVHGNDVHAVDFGVGMFLELQDVDFDGEDMSDLLARVWDEDGDDETLDCTGDDVRTGDDLEETITSDATDGHLLCGVAADALGSMGTGKQPSNYHGVDKVDPDVRLAGSETDDAFDAPTEATPPVEEDADATIFNIDGDGTGLGPWGTGEWGLEAIDDRAGFDQGGMYDAYLGDHFPVYQQLLAVDDDGWAPIGTGPPADEETYSCGTFNAEVNAGANLLNDPMLADDFQRSVLSGDLVCGLAVPRYFRYLGWVVDRAGNFSDMLVFNFLVDQDAEATTSAVGFGTTIYAVGEDAPFAVFGSDDLEVISAEVSLEYPYTEGTDQLLLNFGTFNFPGFERWGGDGDLLSDPLYNDQDEVDDLITEAVTGEDVILPGSMVLGRIDWTQADDGLPAEAGGDTDGDLTEEFNDELTAGAEDEDFLATSVTASLIDAGMNDPTSSATQNFIPAQWDAGVPAPWLGTIDGDETFISWALEQDGDGNVIARHRASSSVIEPIFDEVWLVVNLDGGGASNAVADELVVCAVMDGDDARSQDTGTRRIYLYDLFEIEYDEDDEPVLDADNPCEQDGATFHALGILDGAALGTQPFSFVAPMAP